MTEWWRYLAPSGYTSGPPSAAFFTVKRNCAYATGTRENTRVSMAIGSVYWVFFWSRFTPKGRRFSKKSGRSKICPTSLFYSQSLTCSAGILSTDLTIWYDNVIYQHIILELLRSTKKTVPCQTCVALISFDKKPIFFTDRLWSLEICKEISRTHSQICIEIQAHVIWSPTLTLCFGLNTLPKTTNSPVKNLRLRPWKNQCFGN